MKSDRYNVEIVFSADPPRPRYTLCQELSYCSCKRGAVFPSVCSHRRAVLLWLRSVRSAWRSKGSTASNFHELASQIGLPVDIFEVGHLAVGVPSLQKYVKRNTSNRKRKRWNDIELDDVKAATQAYINDAKKRAYHDQVMRIMQRAREKHLAKKLDLSKYRQLAMWSATMTE